jgi:hypothetical protein
MFNHFIYSPGGWDGSCVPIKRILSKSRKTLKTVRKWGSGEVGKWGSGEVGKWGSGEVGKFSI